MTTASTPTPRLREILAGITTFFTMSYIVVVNPSILSTEGTGMPFDGVLTATVLVAFLGTLFMGIFARLPYAIAPGMGLNAFFTYTLILGKGLPWQTALGLVTWSGIIFLLISITPIRDKIALAVPEELRTACGVGIGIFLSFLGLKSMGLVVAHPVTFVTLGKIHVETGLSLVGLIWSATLLRKNNPFALLSGILIVTLAALGLGKISVPETFVRSPDFTSVMFKMDLKAALQISLIPPLLSILFTDLFDSLSTFLGVARAADLVDEKGQPLRLRQALVIDSIATFVSGIFGSSPGTAYIESAAGIRAGGRTGLTSIVTAICFLPCLFLSPLVSMVPPYATGPVLVLVGTLMFSQVRDLPLDRFEALVPSFLAIVLIPLTFSITQGLLWGFVSWVILHLLAGKHSQVRPAHYAIALLAMFLIIIEATEVGHGL